MKRIKVMLSAIAILAIVGAALAFKAKSYDLKNVYCRTDVGPTTCITVDWRQNDNGAEVTTTLPCLTSHSDIFGNTATQTTRFFANPNCTGTPINQIVYQESND